MMFVWESADIKPGRKYSKEGIGETWLIGYRAEISTGRRYVSVSLNDGLVTEPKTQKELAAELSEHGYVPAEFLGVMKGGAA